VQEPVSFAVDGQKLFGMLHLPDSPGRVPGVLFCHGFTGHRIEAHFLFVKAARALEAAGLAALRFDFRGSGESEGEFRAMTLSQEIDDAAAALDLMEAHPRLDPGRLGVLGLSLGGAVAACLAGRDPRVRSVALWSAVARTRSLCEEPPRQAWGDLIRRHGHLDVGAHEVGLGFIQDLPRHDPVKSLAASRSSALIVHGSADSSVPVSAADLYAEALQVPARRVEKLIVDGADHTFTSLKWERAVIGRTATWFRETLAPQ